MPSFRWRNGYVGVEARAATLVITVLRAQPTLEEWRELQAAVSKFFRLADEEGMHFGLLFDARKAGLLEYDKIREWKNLFDARRDVIQRRVDSTAIVVASRLIRSAANFFLLCYDPVRPFCVANSEEEARAFLASNLNPNRSSRVG